jgi:hypothetical protein
MKAGPDPSRLPLTAVDTIAAIGSPEPGSDIKRYENEQKSYEFHDHSFLRYKYVFTYKNGKRSMKEFLQPIKASLN